MGIVIGVDIGGSTTKIIGLKDNLIISPMLVNATDPIASLFGAFGKFLDKNEIVLNDVDKVMITGVGSSYVKRPVYGISTAKVDEFLCNGLGGLFVSNSKDCIVVSLGTGTALVRANKTGIHHIGGTGVGGGTILGMSNLMLNVRNIDVLITMAAKGNLSNIDLMVGDLTTAILENLPPDTTASNFGNISDLASKNDIALGIFNLVFQTIAMSSIFAAKNTTVKDIVLTGNLSVLPQCKQIFDKLSLMFEVNFIIPNNSNFSTALGCTLAYTKKYNYLNIN
jgi:type II pantothenate kinase